MKEKDMDMWALPPGYSIDEIAVGRGAPQVLSAGYGPIIKDGSTKAQSFYDAITNALTPPTLPLVYDPKITLQALELQYLELAMAHHENNKTHVAKALGITLKTLYNKLHQHKLFNKYQVKPPGRKIK